MKSKEEDEGSVGVGKAGEKAPTWEASIHKGDESARSSSAEGSSADTSGSSEEEEADDNVTANSPEVPGVEADAAEEEAGSNLDQRLGVAAGFTISAKYRRNFRNIAFFAEVRNFFVSVKNFRLNSSFTLKLHQTTLK